MNTIKLRPGEHIYSAATKLVEAAPAKCRFNGITLVARKGTTPEQVVAFYDEESERRAEAWRNSPAGQAYEAEQRERQQRLQEKADSLMRRLPRLDFADISAALAWLCEMEGPRDHVGVTVDARRLIAAFVEHGYQPGANCGDAFNKNDPENFARWIIGQAIQTPYAPLTSHFTEQWRQQFGATVNV